MRVIIYLYKIPQKWLEGIVGYRKLKANN